MLSLNQHNSLLNLSDITGLALNLFLMQEHCFDQKIISVAFCRRSWHDFFFFFFTITQCNCFFEAAEGALHKENI